MNAKRFSGATLGRMIRQPSIPGDRSLHERLASKNTSPQEILREFRCLATAGVTQKHHYAHAPLKRYIATNGPAKNCGLC
ncbi:MAG: hypothetical protein ABR553_11735, partial [Gammaproteobacteria bacterium]